MRRSDPPVDPTGKPVTYRPVRTTTLVCLQDVELMYVESTVFTHIDTY